jgi:predicted nucleotidyltransferase
MLLHGYFMVAPPISLEEIRHAVGSVCGGRPIKRVELFGSRATGSFNASSDVDLLMEFDADAKIGLFELGAIREDLAEQLGVDIDIVSRKAVERSRNAIRRESILSHTVPLYARGLITS